jgi:outer membrane protein assembly factor BamA
MVLRILTYFALITILFTQVEVADIQFAGNKAYEAPVLLELLKSEVGEKYYSYYVNADELTIKNFYEANGYIDVEVSSILENFEKSFTEKRLIFNIRENWRYYFGNISVSGNKIFTSEELLEEFNPNKGDPYQVQKISDWLTKLVKKYKNNGKPFVAIDPQTKFAADNRFSIDLEIKIDEKNTVFFRKINVQSSDSNSLITDSLIIQKEFEFAKGEKYSLEKIEETQKYLYRTGIFQNVNFKAKEIKSGLVDSSTTDSVDMTLNLRERKRSYIGASLGLSTDQDQYIFLKSDDDQPFLNSLSYDLEVDVGKRNIWEGSGTDIGLLINPVFALDENNTMQVFSSKYRIYMAFLNQPFHRFKANLNFTYHELSHPRLNTKLKRLTGNYTTSYQVSDYSFLDFGLTLDVNSEDSTNNPVELKTEEKIRLGFLNSNVYSISANYRIDKRDNFVFPNDGYVVNSRLSASITENEDERVSFYTFRLDWKRYQPFFSSKNAIFASNIVLASVVSDASLKSIPKASRFYSSGLLRGFNTKSPHGPQVQIYEQNSTDSISYLAEGGKFMFILNLEIRRRLINDFYGQVFFDIGSLWRELENVNLNSLRFTYGLGLSYNLDLLVLRLDYGFKFRRLHYDVLDPIFPNNIKKDSPGELSFGFSYHF